MPSSDQLARRLAALGWRRVGLFGQGIGRNDPASSITFRSYARTSGNRRVSAVSNGGGKGWREERIGKTRTQGGTGPSKFVSESLRKMNSGGSTFPTPAHNRHAKPVPVQQSVPPPPQRQAPMADPYLLHVGHQAPPRSVDAPPVLPPSFHARSKVFTEPETHPSRDFSEAATRRGRGRVVSNIQANEVSTGQMPPPSAEPHRDTPDQDASRPMAGDAFTGEAAPAQREYDVEVKHWDARNAIRTRSFAARVICRGLLLPAAIAPPHTPSLWSSCRAKAAIACKARPHCVAVAPMISRAFFRRCSRTVQSLPL